MHNYIRVPKYVCIHSSGQLHMQIRYHGSHVQIVPADVV